MKYSDVKRYLKPHSIHGARITSINGAFASAVVPLELYDPARVLAALEFLGQADPQGDLICVYCDKEDAQTWDHLIPVVKNKQPNGPGHQIGNLIPSCKGCNSRKGNKDWKEFLRSESVRDGRERDALIQRICQYQDAFLNDVEYVVNESDPDWLRFEIIRLKIEALMMEADGIAAEIWKRRQ